MSTVSAAAVKQQEETAPLPFPMTLEARNEAVLEHLPLVRAIAARVRESLPVQVEIDDLVHSGVMGLFDAIEKYNPEKNVAFQLYAKHRIRGAILDSLRQLDWASRDLRKRHKSIEQATQAQAQRLGRAPEENEVASELGVSAGVLQRQKMELHQAGLTSGQPHRVEKLDQTAFLDSAESSEKLPDRLFSERELGSTLTAALGKLPERYRLVIQLYYGEERTMKEIGDTLGVNESRVSQIHKSALQKLHATLRRRGCTGADSFFERSV